MAGYHACLQGFYVLIYLSSKIISFSYWSWNFKVNFNDYTLFLSQFKCHQGLLLYVVEKCAENDFSAKIIHVFAILSNFVVHFESKKFFY